VANFLKNINWICLKFVVFIHHTLIHLWSKFHNQWVHGLGDINKSISSLFMEKCLLQEIFCVKNFSLKVHKVGSGIIIISQKNGNHEKSV
jgi:hypothetical protein